MKKTDQYFYMKLDIEKYNIELITAKLNDMSSFSGILEEETSTTLYFKTETQSETHQLIHTLEEIFPDEVMSESLFSINPANWNEEWEKTIQPIVISNQIIIHPHWVIPDNLIPIQIVITPQMAFGTGYHPSTRGVLRLMLSMEIKGKMVLDCGTGTGVLGIAAVKSGAHAVVGFDNNDWAVENALHNNQANHTNNQFTILTNDFDNFVSTHLFDVILSNVQTDAHQKYLTFYQKHLKSGGIVILSGILTEHRTRLLDQFLNNGFHLEELDNEEEWTSLKLRYENSGH